MMVNVDIHKQQEISIVDLPILHVDHHLLRNRAYLRQSQLFYIMKSSSLPQRSVPNKVILTAQTQLFMQLVLYRHILLFKAEFCVNVEE
jgi:hypothetical protein